MDAVADVARAVLAVVFVVAAVAKLLDLVGTRRTMAAFGASPRLAATAGTLLPFAELAVAVALVLRPSARWGGVAALVLLLLFIVGISNSLARGRRPDCNCFGQVASAPVSWRTLVRNAALAALAGLVAAQGADASLLGWAGDAGSGRDIAILMALGLVAATVVGLLLWRDNRSLNSDIAGLRRQIGRLPAGLPVGLRAPGFELPDVHGETVTLASLCARGRPVVLLFTSPGCGPCVRLVPELERWNTALAERVTFVVVSNGGADRESILEELGAPDDFTALIQERQEVAESYRVTSTPTAVVVDPDGRIATGSAGGPDEIEALVRVALRRAPGPGTPRGELVGQPA
jgi:methylamine dehydrogenase accessory protein MauD